MAANEADSENVQIICEPVGSPKMIHSSKKILQQETEDFPQSDYRREAGIPSQI